MDVVLERTLQVPADEPASDDIEGLARALSERPTTRTATLFTAAVDALQPGPDAASALARAAETIASVERVDVDGRWCLEVVVEKWLSFGYPWALELPPELLASVQRRRAESGSNGWAFVTLASAVLSACWYGFLLVAFAGMVTRSDSSSFDLVRFAFGGLALASLCWVVELLRTMVTASLTDRDAIERAGRRLRNLGQVMWLAPAAVACAAFFDLQLAFILGAMFAPMSITGAAARLSARRLRLALGPRGETTR